MIRMLQQQCVRRQTLLAMRRSGERLSVDDDDFGDTDDFLDSILLDRDDFHFDFDQAIGSPLPGRIATTPSNYQQATRVPTAADLPVPVLEPRPQPPRKLTGYTHAGRRNKPANDIRRPDSGRVGKATGDNPTRVGGSDAVRPVSEQVNTTAPKRNGNTGSKASGDGKRSGRPINIFSDGKRIRRAGTGVAFAKPEINEDVTSVGVPEFQSTNFTCYVKDLKFNIGGEAILQLVIPYENREEAKKLVDTRGLTILAALQRYKYEQD